ncbi:MAG: DUF934 domain-containing protein [Spongiibacteraceae bacterium]
MPNIIKDGQVVADNWQLWSDDALPATGDVIVSLEMWQEHHAKLTALGNIGVHLNSDQSPKLLTNIDKLTVIAIDFPAFADGRGFTSGRELREQHGYIGELRAIGHFMRDQLFFLKRCGFNSFALLDDDLEAALTSFNDFSDVYQASADTPTPVYHRR